MADLQSEKTTLLEENEEVHKKDATLAQEVKKLLGKNCDIVCKFKTYVQCSKHELYVEIVMQHPSTKFMGLIFEGQVEKLTRENEQLTEQQKKLRSHVYDL